MESPKPTEVSDTWGKTCCFLNVNRLITKSRKVQDNCFLKFYRVNNMKLIKCLQWAQSCHLIFPHRHIWTDLMWELWTELWKWYSKLCKVGLLIFQLTLNQDSKKTTCSNKDEEDIKATSSGPKPGACREQAPGSVIEFSLVVFKTHLENLTDFFFPTSTTTHWNLEESNIARTY